MYLQQQQLALLGQVYHNDRTKKHVINYRSPETTQKYFKERRVITAGVLDMKRTLQVFESGSKRSRLTEYTLVTLHIDILFAICEFLREVDLVSLGTTCTFLAKFILLSPTQSSLWKHRLEVVTSRTESFRNTVKRLSSRNQVRGLIDPDKRFYVIRDVPCFSRMVAVVMCLTDRFVMGFQKDKIRIRCVDASKSVALDLSLEVDTYSPKDVDEQV